MKKYKFLIVGSGFFGSTFARLATDDGYNCLVLESRNHIGGNAYTEKIDGIDVHMYGPHIFHTNDYRIWKFVNRFADFNSFILSPKSHVDGKLYSLPFNMNTFYELWGCTTPERAKEIIDSQKFNGTPSNLEEQALSMVGKDIYELLIKGYTKKQWQKDPKDLPADIIKRLPLRFTFDNNYFNDRYQGIPENGYTELFENMLRGIEVKLNTNYFDNRTYYNSIAETVVFTGKIDEFFNYEYGDLDYRSLEFEHRRLSTENFQGVAQMNYGSENAPWTRIIEHKHFTGVNTNNTVITFEYPTSYDRTKVPYYPINDEINNLKYMKYRDLADTVPSVIFGGRLS